MNAFEQLQVKHDALARRVKALEESVRPLQMLQGIDAALISDQAVTSFAAESVGSSLAIVSGTSRHREATAARRQVAGLLQERAEWSFPRIARNLNRTTQGIVALLRKP